MLLILMLMLMLSWAFHFYLGIPIGSSGFTSKTDFIFMIMRVANQDFIDVHNDEESKHSNDHGER